MKIVLPLRLTLAVSVLMFSGLTFSGPAVALSELAPNSPPDKPGNVRGEEQAQRLLKSVAPYIAQARKTWPSAKKRYLAGLPVRHVFFVTVRLVESDGKFEIVFLEVKKIEHGMISGEIANDITLLKGYRKGQIVTVPEAEIWDWTISKPDGSEEGNVVGKFLDSYQP